MWWLVTGAIAGSVANALIYRLPRGLDWRQGRSFCPKCKRQLAWPDLIPLLSYVWLRAKCRYCAQRIGLRYFAVELGLAVGFAYFRSPLLAAMLFVTAIIAAMDWESLLVSEWLVGAWLALALWANWPNWANLPNLAGLAIAGGLIGGIWALSRGRAMGFGDVEIAAVAGLWLGWPRIAPALWLAFVAGALVGIWLLVIGKKKLKSRIAFGPFLILGAWLGYLIQWQYVFPF